VNHHSGKLRLQLMSGMATISGHGETAGVLSLGFLGIEDVRRNRDFTVGVDPVRVCCSA